MKNKKKIIGMSLLFSLIGCILVVVLIDMDRNKPYPIERYRDRQEQVQTEQTQEEQAQTDPKQERTEESEDATAGDADSYAEFEQGNFTYEFLSCEVLEETELEDNPKYPAEYFYSGEVPTEENRELRKIWDFATEVKEVGNPEYEYALLHRFAYDKDEYFEIITPYEDLYSKYTQEGYPDSTYYFVHMRITNQSDKERDISVNELRLIRVNEDYTYCETNGECCYFDAAQNTEYGEVRTHRFPWYHMMPGEVLDCTVGYQWCNNTIYEENPWKYAYIGLFSVETENDWICPVPCKTAVDLDTLAK